MGLLDFLLQDKEDDEDILFQGEAEAFGLDDEEIEEARECGMTPEEWARENYDDFDDYDD